MAAMRPFPPSSASLHCAGAPTPPRSSRSARALSESTRRWISPWGSSRACQAARPEPRRREAGPKSGRGLVGGVCAVALSLWLRSRLRARVRRRSSEGESGPLGIAERYSSEDWFRHFVDLPYSAILRRTVTHLSGQTLLAVAVCVFQELTGALTPFPSTPLLLCASALGLLLVFRTNAAYERWCQGQQNVYLLRHHLQQLLRMMRPWLTEERFMRLQTQVSAFPRAIATHLTAKPGAGFLYGIGPRDLVTQISDELAVHFAGSRVPMSALYAHDRAQGHIDQALRCVGDMERLAVEAIPRDYSRHTSRFLTVWCASLPFVLLDCGRFMPLGVAIASWALLSIEEIGHTLEDPFNSPTQPIPVKAILESGGGEHSLAPARKASNEAAPPAAAALWERRVAWEDA